MITVETVTHAVGAIGDLQEARGGFTADDIEAAEIDNQVITRIKHIVAQASADEITAALSEGRSIIWAIQSIACQTFMLGVFAGRQERLGEDADQ